MALGRKKLFMAVEEFENESRGDVDLADTQVGVDEASADVSDSVEETGELSAAIEEAMEDADTLGAIHDVMEDSVESGEGLTPAGAEITEISVEAIRNRLGMSTVNKVIPSLESFGSSNSRVHATRVAMEGVRDTIKSLWEGIRKAFASLREKIKAFFSSLMNNAAKIETHLKEIQKSISGVEGKAEKDKIPNIGLAKTFTAGKKEADVTTATTIINNSSKLLDFGLDVSSMLNSYSLDISKLITSEAPDMNKLKETTLRRVGELKKIFNSFSIQDDERSILNFPLAGCKGLKWSGEKAEGDEKVYLPTLEIYSGEEAATEIKVLTTSEMQTVIKAGIKLTGDIKNYQKTAKMFSDVSSAVTKMADKVIAAVDKGAVADAKDQKAGGEELTNIGDYYDSIRKNVGILSKYMSSLSVPLPGLAFAAAKGAGEYVQASISQYKKA